MVGFFNFPLRSFQISNKIMPNDSRAKLIFEEKCFRVPSCVEPIYFISGITKRNLVVKESFDADLRKLCNRLKNIYISKDFYRSQKDLVDAYRF